MMTIIGIVGIAIGISWMITGLYDIIDGLR